MFGIKLAYPRVRKYFGKLADYIALLRPMTLVAPLFAGFFGVLIQLAYDHELYLFWNTFDEIIYVALTLALLQAGGQVVNQITDVEIDKINKPYRPIPSGRITTKEASGIALLLYLFSLARASTVNARFLFWCTLIAFFSAFYSLKPIRAKKRLWFNLLWMAISRGLFPFLASWSVYGNEFSTSFPWVLGLINTLWVLALQTTKDFPDVEGDKKFGIETLPVKYGAKKAKVIMVDLLLAYLLAYAYLIVSGLLDRIFFAHLVFTCVLGLFSVKAVNIDAQVTENNLGWVGFYSGLASTYIFAFIALLIV